MSTDEDVTKPSGMPAQPATRQLPAADKNEILLAEMKSLIIGGFKRIDEKVDGVDAKVERLEGSLDLQGGQIGVMQKEIALVFEWKGDVEQRLKLSSMRAAAPSNVDMKHEAALMEVIAKDQDRDRQIAETRALAEQAATKEDVASLAEGTATKAEVKALVETSSEALTVAIGDKLGAQDTILSDQNGKLDSILKIAKATAAALGSKRLRYFLLVCAALGAMAGGAVAGWNAHEVSKVLPQATPPQLPSSPR
jgi:hypothetical protein